MRVFDVPGDLGPSGHRRRVTTRSPTAAQRRVPARRPRRAASPWRCTVRADADACATAARRRCRRHRPCRRPTQARPHAAMAAPPSAPALGGLPDVGGGLGGLGQQLADAFGGLLGSADEALPRIPPELEEPEVDERRRRRTDASQKPRMKPSSPQRSGRRSLPPEEACRGNPSTTNRSRRKPGRPPPPEPPTPPRPPPPEPAAAEGPRGGRRNPV